MFIPLVIHAAPGVTPDDYLAAIAGRAEPSRQATRITPPDPAGLPYLSQQDGLAQIPPEARPALEDKLDVALAYWNGRVGLRPGEQVQHQEIGCLGDRWLGLPKGTLVYRRVTGLAELVCILPGAAIDLPGGTLRAQSGAIFEFSLMALATPREAVAQPMLMAGQDGKDIKAIIEAAQAVLSLVGAGIDGAWGLANAGATPKAGALFDAFFKTGQAPPAIPLGEIVRELLGQPVITGTANHVADALALFAQNWRALPSMDAPQRAALRALAEDQIRPTSPLNAALRVFSGEDRVTVMSANTLQRETVALYGLGVAVALLWRKLAIVLDDSGKAQRDKSKSAHLHGLVDLGTAACAHIEQVQAGIETTIAERGAKVSHCFRTSYAVAVFAGETTIECWAFQDPDDPWSDYDWLTHPGHLREMTAIDTGCCNQNQHKAQCEAKRATYITKVEGVIRDTYHYDAARITALREALGATVDQYRRYLLS